MLERTSKPSLKRSLYSVILPDGCLILMCTPEEPIILQNLSAFQRELLLLLDGTVTVEEIAAILSKKKVSCSTEEILKELNGFHDRLLLEDDSERAQPPTWDNEVMQRYDRQRLFFAAAKRNGYPYGVEVQKKLRDTHVVLFGLGGFGSHLFYQLTAMGIGRITAVDYDNVEYSNLNRQCLFRESDIGKAKLEVLREQSQFLNSLIDYNFINKKITSAADFLAIIKSSDLVILAADSPREHIFEWLNEASYKAKVPVLYSLGVTHSFARIGPLVVPGETGCFNCSMPEVHYNDPLVRFINARHQHAVIVPSIMTACGIMMLEAIKHLTHFNPCRLYDQRIHFNLQTYEITFQKIERRETCPFCGKV